MLEKDRPYGELAWDENETTPTDLTPKIMDVTHRKILLLS